MAEASTQCSVRAGQLEAQPFPVHLPCSMLTDSTNCRKLVYIQGAGLSHKGAVHFQDNSGRLLDSESLGILALLLHHADLGAWLPLADLAPLLVQHIPVSLKAPIPFLLKAVLTEVAMFLSTQLAAAHTRPTVEALAKQ